MNPVFTPVNYSFEWTVVIIVLVLCIAGIITGVIKASSTKTKNLGQVIATISIGLLFFGGGGGALLTISSSLRDMAASATSGISKWSEKKYDLILPESSSHELILVGNITNQSGDSILDYKNEDSVLKTYGSTKINLKDGPTTIVLILREGELILADSSGEEIEKQ